MIDSGVSEYHVCYVMKELGLDVDTPYGKCYSMENRLVLVVGIMKGIEFRF